MGCGDVRLLKTIGSVDFTGQERAALNKLTMPSQRTTSSSSPGVSHECRFHVRSVIAHPAQRSARVQPRPPPGVPPDQRPGGAGDGQGLRPEPDTSVV